MTKKPSKKWSDDEKLQAMIEWLTERHLDTEGGYSLDYDASTFPGFVIIADLDDGKERNRTEPVAYVLSLNLHRRHLTAGQTAMVGARVREWYDKKAQERMNEGQKSGGRGHKKNSPENLPDSFKGDARDQAGKAVGVSGKSIDHATKVLKHAVPEVIKAVDEGRMAVSTAAILSSEPGEVQRREVQVDSQGRKRNRKYGPVKNGERIEPDDETPAPDPDNNPEDRKVRSKGIELAHEAINCLARIPKNDIHRKRGFQIVTDWIKQNR